MKTFPPVNHTANNGPELPLGDHPAFNGLELQRFNAFPVAKLPAPKGGKEPTPEFCVNVKRFGVIFPIVVLAVGENGLVVRDGLRRLKAAIAAKLQTIPMVLIHGSSMSGAAIGLAVNELRSSNPVAEVNLVKDMVKEGATQAHILNATGLTVQRLRKLMGLTLLKPELYRAIEEGKITDTLGKKLAKMPADEQGKAFEIYSSKGSLAAKDVANIRRVEAQAQVAEIPSGVFDQVPVPRSDLKAHALIGEAAGLLPDGPLKESAIKLAAEILADANFGKAA